MTEAKSQFGKGTMALVILLPVVAAACWFGRGVYDRLFLLEGQVLIVNATARDHGVSFAFPAGEEIEADLKAGASSQTVIGNTGEGAIVVTIDGNRREEVGYVTSMNGMIVLTIDEDRVIFSQVSL